MQLIFKHNASDFTVTNKLNRFQINIFNSINNASPNVEGMTAIASWMIACIFFVFGALLGYAGLLYYLLVSHHLLKTWVFTDNFLVEFNQDPILL